MLEYYVQFWGQYVIDNLQKYYVNVQKIAYTILSILLCYFECNSGALMFRITHFF